MQKGFRGEGNRILHAPRALRARADTAGAQLTPVPGNPTTKRAHRP
jgi:hypothetical protein